MLVALRSPMTGNKGRILPYRFVSCNVVDVAQLVVTRSSREKRLWLTQPV